MNLENRFFFRLVKVTYISLLSISCLIGFFISWFIGNAVLFYGVLYGVLFVGISYAILNIAKNVLLYIAFGKSFQWITIFQRFFEKLNSFYESYNSIHTDPQGAAEKLIIMLLDKEKPFSYCEQKSADDYYDTAYCASIGYSFYIYLLLIRNKFGKETASMVRHHLITLLNRMENNTGEEIVGILNMIEFTLKSHGLAEINLLIDDSVNAEYVSAAYFLVTWPCSPLYLPDEKRRHITYEEVVKHCGEESIYIVFEHLVNTKNEAILSFKPIINSFKFKPESIRGLEVCEEIAWSKNPGCFENHLKRKFNNPLFSPKNRVVTQAQVNQARKRDDKDTTAFRKEANLFTNELLDESNRTPCEMNKLREKVNRLIDRAFQVGGKALDILPALMKAKDAITESLRSFIELNENKLQEFIRAEDFHKNGYESKYRDVFIMQFIRDDSPIRIDLHESILSENLQKIKAFFRIAFENEKDNKIIDRFKNDIIKVVDAMHSRGENIPILEKKLKILGITSNY